jgi:hypothetical protein
MSERRFAVRGRTPKARGRLARGSTVSWTLNRRATVRLRVQRLVRGRWRAVGSLAVNASGGRTRLPFSGSVAGRRLSPGRYRLVVAATAGGRTATAKPIAFSVVKA